MARTPHHRTALLVAMLVGVLALSGCSIRDETREPLETAIPAALEASDLGITSANASMTISGFAVNVYVGIGFDRASVTPADLRSVLAIVVAKTNLSRVYDLTIHGYDATALDGSEADGSHEIDLAMSGANLGFAAKTSDQTQFTAHWDDVRKFLRK